MESVIGGTINTNLLIDLAKIAHTELNKNKNSLCRAIDLSEKTIVDWYNEINFAYAPFRSYYILGEKMSDKKIITNFLVFAEILTHLNAHSYPEQPDEQSMQEANNMFLAFVRGEYEN